MSETSGTPPTSEEEEQPETEEERTARLKQFVLDMLDGQILTTFDVPQNMWKLVFFPLFASESTPELLARLEDSACLYGHWRDRIGDRGVNGLPMLAKVGILSKADWARVYPPLKAELERRKEIKV